MDFFSYICIENNIKNREKIMKQSLISAKKNLKLGQKHWIYALTPKGREVFSSATMEKRVNILNSLVDNGNISSQDMINILIKQ